MRLIVILMLWCSPLLACVENFNFAYDFEGDNGDGTELWTFNMGWEYGGGLTGVATFEIQDVSGNILQTYSTSAINEEFEIFYNQPIGQEFCHHFYVDDQGSECFDNGVQCFVLPVELISWQATKIESVALLSWATATESNNRGFEVHHSEDGRNWKLIGFVEGHNNTDVIHNYQFETDMSRGDNYYSLRQFDYDGSETIYDTRHIFYDGVRAVSVFPNPANHVVSFQVNESDDCELQNATIVEDVSALPPGRYWRNICGRWVSFTKI